MASLTLYALLFAADLGDWLQLLVPAVFVIIWVLSQILGGGQQAKGRPAQRRQGRAQGDQPPGKLRGEIDDFLRRVKEQAGIPDQEEEDVEEEEWAEPKPDAAERFPRARPEVMEAELVNPPLRAALAPGVGSRSIEQADERFAQRSQRLGAHVGLADEKLESHMHEVFDHQLGSLGGTKDLSGAETPVPSAPSVKIPTAADEIREMLAAPDGVRKAIVMSEILNRPESRW